MNALPSPEDAEEAFRGFRKALSLRHNWPLPAEDDPLLFQGSTGDHVGLVAREENGTRILVAEAQAKERLAEILSAVGW